jgi:hypothetical protein
VVSWQAKSARGLAHSKRAPHKRLGLRQSSAAFELEVAQVGTGYLGGERRTAMSSVCVNRVIAGINLVAKSRAEERVAETCGRCLVLRLTDTIT